MKVPRRLRVYPPGNPVRSSSKGGLVMRHLGTRALVALSLAIAAILPAAGVVGAATPVDPSTLTPPPPDVFDAKCVRTGSHITCTLAFSDPDISGEASGLFCGSTELLADQTRDVVGKRVYNGDGLLLQRHFRESFTGRFTNPDNGRYVLFLAHDTIIHDLGVPGDLETGVTRLTGQWIRAFVPGGGSVMLDTGTWLEDPANDGEITFRSGHHRFLDWVEGDEAAAARLCAALA
jgi:hypothetical protein